MQALRMCSVFLLALSLGLVAAETASGEMVPYDGHRVVRVTVESQEQLDLLLTMTDDVWGEGAGLGRMDVRVSPEQYQRLKQSGLTYMVLIEDLQREIDRQWPGPGPRGPFDDYMPYADVLAYLDTLVDLRPDLAETVVVGQSIEGRDIVAIRITGPGGGTKPGILYHGGQHAREWITVPVPVYIADQLIREYDNDPCIQDLVDRIEWFLIPVMNPDGYVYSWEHDRMWRKNRRDNEGSPCYGVDLNRNWGVGWGGQGSSGDPCSPTYRGTHAFSEPETSAIRDWILTHPNIVAYTDLHSYSQIIHYPYSYDDILPPEPDLSEYRYLAETMAAIVYSVHGKVYTYGHAYHVVYQVSGASRDWVYGEGGVIAFGYELRDTGQYGFLLPPEQIIPQCEEVAPALLFYADYMSIPQKVLTPDGGEVWSVGQLRDITWFAHAGTATSVDLYHSTDGGNTFPHEIATGEPHDGVYAWTVPDTPSAHCRVKVVVHYDDMTTGEDISDGDFVITDQGPQLVYDFPLDSAPGWATEGKWAFGQPTGGGGQYGYSDPTSGHTGPYVYGYNLYGDYENYLPERHLTSAALDCSDVSAVTLSFWRWLGVEQPAYDHAYVRVSNDGSSWTTVWQNPEEITDSSWGQHEIDISSVADGQSTVYLRWTMGTTDTAWQYCGWNIDDIQIWGIQLPQFLVGDLNCDGEVDFNDINPFVLALTDEEAYEQMYPGCPFENRDINGDGNFDFGDINPFVGLLTS